LTDNGGNVTKTYQYDAFGNEKNHDPQDLNPFRYCGEYFDKETGSIYLRARYYQPTTGRFQTEDLIRSAARKMPNGQELVDPLSLNLYTYSANNPVMYHDPNGTAWETVFDAASIIWSGADLIKNPSWANLGFLLWDVGATLVPFVPGSYTVKGGKLLVKATDKSSDVVKAFNALNKADKLAAVGNGNVIMAYKDLKKVTKGLDLQAHHLIEKRFASTLGMKQNNMLSIAIDKNTHQKITNLMREKMPYGKSYTQQQIWERTRDVYKELGMTEYLDVLKQSLIDSGAAKNITNWGKW